MWYATSIVAGELLKFIFGHFQLWIDLHEFEIVGWICILHVDAFKHWGWCCPFGAIQYISDAWYGNFRTFVLSLVCDCPYHASTGRIADTFGKLASIVRCLKIVWIWLGGVGYNITSAHYYLVIIFVSTFDIVLDVIQTRITITAAMNAFQKPVPYAPHTLSISLQSSIRSIQISRWLFGHLDVAHLLSNSKRVYFTFFLFWSLVWL